MKRILKGLVGLAVLAGAASAANAAINITNITYDPGSRGGNINVNGGTFEHVGAPVGRFSMSGTDTVTNNAVSFLTYCIDLGHSLGNGLFTIEPVSLLIADPVKQTQLLTLLSNTASAITNAPTADDAKNISAAIQSAVWEIAYETGNASYNINTGNLLMNGGGAFGPTYRALTNTYLNNITSNVWTPLPGYSVSLLYNQSNQSQIFLGVPEPAAWGFMLVGFALAGTAMRRRGAIRTVTA